VETSQSRLFAAGADAYRQLAVAFPGKRTLETLDEDTAAAAAGDAGSAPDCRRRQLTTEEHRQIGQ